MVLLNEWCFVLTLGVTQLTMLLSWLQIFSQRFLKNCRNRISRFLNTCTNVVFDLFVKVCDPRGGE